MEARGKLSAPSASIGLRAYRKYSPARISGNKEKKIASSGNQALTIYNEGYFAE
jgi:hypothetical protein